MNLQGGLVITTKDFLQGCISVPFGRSGVAQLSTLIKHGCSFLQSHIWLPVSQWQKCQTWPTILHIVF